MPLLDFKGKSVVYSHHLAVPFRTLNLDRKKSLLPASARAGKAGKGAAAGGLDDNLIIHGDNLHALKALLPRYSGKIQCVYIDPPYNTGHEGWKYNDRVNSPLMREWLRQNGIGLDDQERHDKWLCMMWPRLQLLKELLSEDGVIFISIDDNEQHHLRMIMDEIFGEENFIGAMKRRASRKTAHLSRKMSDMCDYIFAYCKNGLSSPLGVNPVEESTRPVFNAENPVSLRYVPSGADAKCPDGLYKKGSYKALSMRFELLDDLKVKNGKTVGKTQAKGRFRVSQKILDQAVYITKNFSLRRYVTPQEKSKIKALHDLIDQKDFYNEKGSERLKEILPKSRSFQNPKPVELIKFLIKSQENGAKSKDYIVLDSFAGSGTTAHAVLDLNREDGGSRKFILVECEDYADSITAERVRCVIKGVPKARDESLRKGLGGSFSYCSLGDEINAENMLKGRLPPYRQLAEYIFYTATGKILDKAPKPNPTWFIGETEFLRLHLAYKPDVGFLRGGKADLTLSLAEAARAENKGKKRVLVFAPAKYIDQTELKRDYGIEFCHLPYDIYKIIEG